MSSVVSFLAVLTSSHSDWLNPHSYTKTRSGILDCKTQTGMILVQIDQQYYSEKGSITVFRGHYCNHTSYDHYDAYNLSCPWKFRYNLKICY